jgi:hypothetical protein
LDKKFTRKYFSDSDNVSHKYERLFQDLDVDSRQAVVFDDDPVSAAAALAVVVESDSIFLLPGSG